MIRIGTKRKTRKDMPTRNSMKHSYSRAPKSASPLLLNRGHQEQSESGDELDQEAEEYEDDDLDDHDSYENPDNIIENELENGSYVDSTPTATTYDEQDPNNNGESLEDLGKYNLRELIYKMFLNIYNSEKENTERLRREIFPKITEETKLDDYITYAINNCMDHVKDELQIFIKKNLKLQRKKMEGPQKSMIKDSSFIPVDENIQKYNELIDKIIDFYELFKCSIEHIEAAWKEKLGHIDRLYDIFDYRHKKLFSVNIWQDREIREVIKLFFSQNYDYESYKKRTEDINTIEQELNENLQSIVRINLTLASHFSFREHAC